MQEIELKIKYDGSERDKVIRYCNDAGFMNTGEYIQTDCYLTPSHRNIYSEDKALRVRSVKSGGRTSWFITFKGKNDDPHFHSREEIESEIKEGEELIGILRLLDFSEILTIQKHRLSYKKGRISICIDDVKDLGDYVEVEYITSEKDHEQAKAIIDGIVKDLNLRSGVIETKNYLQLLAVKNRSLR